MNSAACLVLAILPAVAAHASPRNSTYTHLQAPPLHNDTAYTQTWATHSMCLPYSFCHTHTADMAVNSDVHFE